MPGPSIAIAPAAAISRKPLTWPPLNAGSPIKATVELNTR